ncbi:MAG: hypothetical protein OEZ06_28345 [Myxococcales bacterium]|nr:hypothetical protein [Myxococcales bacterium]
MLQAIGAPPFCDPGCEVPGLAGSLLQLDPEQSTAMPTRLLQAYAEDLQRLEEPRDAGVRDPAVIAEFLSTQGAKAAEPWQLRAALGIRFDRRPRVDTYCRILEALQTADAVPAPYVATADLTDAGQG